MLREYYFMRSAPICLLFSINTVTAKDGVCNLVRRGLSRAGGVLCNYSRDKIGKRDGKVC